MVKGGNNPNVGLITYTMPRTIKKKKKEKIYTTVEWSSGGKSRVEIFGYGMYHSLKKGMAVLVFEKLKGKDKKKFKNKKWLPIE